jgi:hypothetical protein
VVGPIPPLPPEAPIPPVCSCNQPTPPPPVPPKPPIVSNNPGVKTTTGAITVVGAGETALAFTGIGGLSMLLPGAAILLILGMMLLVLARREHPEAE